MIYLILLLAVLFGFTRGVKEGMVMIQHQDGMAWVLLEGVRSHYWFKYYHAISALAFCFFALGYGMLLRLPFGSTLIALILFIIWEAYELGYSIARYSKLIPDQENLLLFRIWNGHVVGLHIVRGFVIAILFRAILMKG